MLISHFRDLLNKNTRTVKIQPQNPVKSVSIMMGHQNRLSFLTLGLVSYFPVLVVTFSSGVFNTKIKVNDSFLNPSFPWAPYLSVV